MVISAVGKKRSGKAMQQRNQYDHYRPDLRNNTNQGPAPRGAPPRGAPHDLIRDRQNDLIRDHQNARGGRGMDLFDWRPPPHSAAQFGRRQDEAVAPYSKQVPTGPAAHKREEGTTNRERKQASSTPRSSQKGASRNAEGKSPDDLYRRFVSAMCKRIRSRHRFITASEKEVRLKEELDRCNINDAEFGYVQQLISSQREKARNDAAKENAEIQKTDGELRAVMELWESKLLQSVADRVIKHFSTSESSTVIVSNGHGESRDETASNKDLEQMKEAFEGRLGALSNQMQAIQQELETEKDKNSSSTTADHFQRLRQDLEVERDRINSIADFANGVSMLRQELQDQKQRIDQTSNVDQRFQKLQQDIEDQRYMTSSLPTLLKQSERLHQELEMERQNKNSNVQLAEQVERLEQELEAEKQKNKLLSRMKEHYESLQETQMAEKQRSDRLEQKINQLVAQASEAKAITDIRDDAEPTQNRHNSRRPSANTSIEVSPAPTSMSAVIKSEDATTAVTRVELDRALREVDDNISGIKDITSNNKPGRKTARILRSLMADLKIMESHIDNSELQSCVHKLSETVNACEQKLQEQTDQHAALQSKIASLASGGAAVASISSFSMDDVKQLVETEITTGIRQAIPRIKERLESGLADEASKREKIGEEMKRVVAECSALVGQIESINSQVENIRQALPAGGSQSEELASLSERTTTWKAATLRDMEELRMQCLNIKAWQDAFSTRPLCKEIVDYINATMPNGLQRQITGLAIKIDAWERRMSVPEAAGLKRRRTEDDTTAPVHGAR